MIISLISSLLKLSRQGGYEKWPSGRYDDGEAARLKTKMTTTMMRMMMAMAIEGSASERCNSKGSNRLPSKLAPIQHAHQ